MATSYALCILCVLYVLGTWFYCQLSEKPQMNPAGSIPDNSLLYFRFGHLPSHAPVPNELRDNRHKCAQMKLPHYSPLLMSFQPNVLSLNNHPTASVPPSLHPSSLSPSGVVFDMWKKNNLWRTHTLTHTHTPTSTQFMDVLRCFTTHCQSQAHTPPFKFSSSQSLSFAALGICCHHWH